MAMTAAQMITLKAKVKAEMLRRQYTGSVAAYGGAAYDFAVVPSQGQPVTAEQGNKIIQPLLAVKDISGLSVAVQGGIRPDAFDYTNLNTIVTNLAGEAMTGSSSCRSSCTGLCEGNCQNTCSSCTGSCLGSCYNSCYGDCSGTCSAVCRDSCSNNCFGNCDSYCALQGGI